MRKQSFGVGEERTFPVHSPKIERIEVASRGAVRRAKLYYLRDRVGRSARVRERRFTGQDLEVYAEGVMPPPEADLAVTDAAAATDTAPPELDPRNEGVEEIAEAEVPDTGDAAPGAQTEAPDAPAGDTETPASDATPADAAAPVEDATEAADERGA